MHTGNHTQSGWVPSISGGYGYNTVSGATESAATNSQIRGWLVFTGMMYLLMVTLLVLPWVKLLRPRTAGVEDPTLLEFFYKYPSV
jgi:hypothetical protein